MQTGYIDPIRKIDYGNFTDKKEKEEKPRKV